MDRIKTKPQLIIILFFALLLFGALYQWICERADREKIPGALISVHDMQFHLLCRGEGQPLVLLENGLWGSYPDWLYVLNTVSEYSKVCAYDRLGMGWSSANNKPTHAVDVANNLNQLLKTAGLDKPVILVGFSAGGLYVRKYLDHFPEKVVGMVLLDSAHEQQSFRIQHIDKNLSLEKFCSMVAWTGVARAFNLFGDYVDDSFSLERHDEQMRAYNRSGLCSGLILQSQGFVEDLMANQTPKDMGELPLVVIQAGIPLREQILTDDVPSSFLDEHERIWPQLQRELSGLSRNSKYLIAEESGHAIQLEQPEIAIKAIINMLEEYNSK